MLPYPDGIETFPGGGFLKDRSGNETSQFGEDGLIAAALEKFGICNQWCFEVGAADGLFFSNTKSLRDRGWFAVLIEGNSEQYEKLAAFASDRVFTIHKTISQDSLDTILATCDAPPDLDFGVIDIDGQDYWAWRGLKQFQPRLMLLEFRYKSEHDEPDIPEIGGKGQANYKAILTLGREKGYSPLAKTHCNILFCRSELLT